MKHYGDICKINGADVEPVNVVIGGSPCQGLSVAGKQEGLADERSVLYIEQLRVIKEMRRADIERGRKGADIRPRFMVWENVPGAFSSNNRTDFASVLQETIKVVCEQTPSVPIPKNGWPSSGCLTDLGGQWSIAWRVLDAQFWGVPQRRKRIALVADFGGLTAPEILFERQGVPGYIEPCGEKRKRTSGNIEKGIDTTITARGGAMCHSLCALQTSHKLSVCKRLQRPREPICASRQIDCSAPIMYENYQFANYRKGCGTLKASGGDYGGGSENLIVYQR